MVVTRRTPAPPVPTSRTNSAQPIPRVKGKAPHTVPDVPSPLANGSSRAEPGDQNVPIPALNEENSEKKGKGKQKGKHKEDKKKKSKKSTTFTEFLTRIFLLWLTIYTLSICPTDEKLQSPICRGLHQYRKVVLEPYLLPPLQYAISHPTVAPYVDRAKPYVNRVITTAKPVVFRVHHEWLTRVVPHWEKTIIPQWHKHVVPQWKRHVVPHWKQHVSPHIAEVERQLEPYVTGAYVQYEHRIGPHAHIALYNLHKWQQQARPYVVLAAHKSYDGYTRVKPYAKPVLQRLKLLLCKISQFLGEQRRQFVDPHVKQIWERVNELSNGDAPRDIRQKFTASVSEASSVIGTIVVPATPVVQIGTASPVLPDTPAVTETVPVGVPSDTLSSTYQSVLATPEVFNAVPSVNPTAGKSVMTSVVSSAASVAPSVTEQIIASASSLGSAVISAFLESAVPAAASVAHDTILNPVSSLSAQLSTSDASAETASVAHEDVWASTQDSSLSQTSAASAVIDEPESTVPTSGSTVSAAPGQLTDAPVIISSQDAEEADEDDFLAKFYAELGLDQDFMDLDSSFETDATEPAVQTEAEAEAEEENAEKLRLKKEETAKKRADITARHANWEKELDEKIQQNRKALRKSLVALRKVAVQELKENKDIRQEVEGLVEEAEKYLKGAEKYLDQLRKESRSVEEKRIIWDRVAEKVDKKFEERLGQTEAVVNSWYLKIIEQETQEVKRHAAEVKDIADRAQADVGLDYAYLDDVTYADWQRYHGLDRKSENFTAQAYSIQDGSHPSPPINPVLPAIQDLQNEVQDVVVGFETRLRRIRRNGERAFSAEGTDEQLLPGDTSQETISILPIAHKELESDSPAVPPVVIGRSKDEILSALDRAAEHDAQATSAPEDEGKQPEQVVQSLVQEAVAEGSLISSPNSQHVEL